MKSLTVAACCVAIIVLVAAEASGRTAAHSGPRAECLSGAVSAVVAGKRVCLKAGQLCSSTRDAVYQRYGFTCTKRARLARLVRSQLSRSLYLSVSEDYRVDVQRVLLAGQVDLPKPDGLFVEADGTFGPAASDSAASVYIQVDSKRVSNFS